MHPRPACAAVTAETWIQTPDDFAFVAALATLYKTKKMVPLLAHACTCLHMPCTHGLNLLRWHLMQLSLHNLADKVNPRLPCKLACCIASVGVSAAISILFYDKPPI